MKLHGGGSREPVALGNTLKRLLDDLSQSWQKMYQQTIDDSSSTLSLGGEAACWDEHADDDNLDHRIFSRLPAVGK